MKNTENIDKMLVYVVDIIRKAGEPLKQVARENLSVERKNENIMDIVTEYDQKTEEFIIGEIQKRYGDHGFIA